MDFENAVVRVEIESGDYWLGYITRIIITDILFNCHINNINEYLILEIIIIGECNQYINWAVMENDPEILVLINL